MDREVPNDLPRARVRIPPPPPPVPVSQERRDQLAEARVESARVQEATLADDKATFKRLYWELGGIPALVCRRMGMSRKTYLRWKASDPEFAQDLKDIDEEILDLSEAALLKLVNKGDRQAIIFLLKTKGKSRGYVERQELTGANGAPLGMTVNVEDMKQDFPPESLDDLVRELHGIQQQRHGD